MGSGNTKLKYSNNFENIDTDKLHPLKDIKKIIIYNDLKKNKIKLFLSLISGKIVYK